MQTNRLFENILIFIPYSSEILLQLFVKVITYILNESRISRINLVNLSLYIAILVLVVLMHYITDCTLHLQKCCAHGTTDISVLAEQVLHCINGVRKAVKNGCMIVGGTNVTHIPLLRKLHHFPLSCSTVQ